MFNRTEFQVYCNDCVIDFTERKLIKIMIKTCSTFEKLKLLELIKEYIERRVAVSWKNGVPQYLRLSNE
jgi:hypothetical protein